MKALAMRLIKLDAKIITLVCGNGRRSNGAIARRLGVAEGRVRKRIDRLISEEVIQIGAWADRYKIGHRAYINVDIPVGMRNIARIANRLAKLPEISFLGVSTGKPTISAGCRFRSTDHFHEFMARHVAEILGIRSVSTTVITKDLKREQSLRVLPVGAGNGNEGGRER